MPRLINMRGRKGDLPANTVYIGRETRRLNLPRSKWHNPFVVGKDGTRAQVIAKYREHLKRKGLVAELEELRGKDLACWCWPEPCHGDVLLELLYLKGMGKHG